MITLRDYFFIISPPHEVIYEVSRFKKACAKYIGEYDSLYSKAHISLGLFAEEVKGPPEKGYAMERFIRLISEDIALIEPVRLRVSGFKFFSHGRTRTIYAAVETDAATTAWFDYLRGILTITGDIIPHITIARSISVEHFNILWPFFEKASFKYSFVPGCITVLTREVEGRPGNYSLYKEMPFWIGEVTTYRRISG